jgi:prepilin-type processing-associated H-X9-DG protein
MASVPLPAAQTVFFDGKLLCTFDSPFFDPGSLVSFPASSAAQKNPRHFEGVNLAFADGHSKFQKAKRSPTVLNGFWTAASGPFVNRVSFWGLVNEQEQYGGCP